MNDDVLDAISNGRGACRLFRLVGSAIREEEMIVQFFERCQAAQTAGVELLVNKGVRGYLAEYMMDRWESQYRGCRMEVTNHFEDVTVSRVLLSIGGVTVDEVLAQQSKSTSNTRHDVQIDVHQKERERGCTLTICIQGDEGTTASSLSYLVTNSVGVLLEGRQLPTLTYREDNQITAHDRCRFVISAHYLGRLGQLGDSGKKDADSLAPLYQITGN